MSTTIKKIVNTSNAPKSNIPYNQAIVVGNIAYLSGILGNDKETLQIVPGGIVEEAKKALENLRHTLEAAGSKIENVIKCTVLLNDMNDFEKVNQEYKKVFTHDCPARTCFQVGKLPAKANIEIESIAIVGNVKTEYVQSKL